MSLQLRFAAWLLLLAPVGLVCAAIVSAADIVHAIQQSPTATPWIKANAQAIANLAINVESGGKTTAYNGSCCYGVLQMNTANIKHYAKVSPETYRNWSLQQQINAWAELTRDALKARSVRQLIGMGTFDGRPVDGHLVLACVQLGIGNCQKMINAGSCSGFADRNGTTICSMADKMSGTRPNNPGTPPDAGAGAGSGTTNGSNSAESGTGSGIGPWKPSSCARDGSGNCMSISAAIREGFRQGSGMDMSSIRAQVQQLGAAVVMLIIAACTAALWPRYADGRLSVAQLKKYALHAGITLCIVLGVMQVL